MYKPTQFPPVYKWCKSASQVPTVYPQPLVHNPCCSLRPAVLLVLDSAGCPKKNRAFDDLTNELKKLNPDDLRAQTDEYKQLLAARDLAELGFS